MTGTRAGGLKTAAKVKREHYQRIGAMGGRKSRGGGFTGNKARAREMGRLGGLASTKAKQAAPTQPVSDAL